MVLTKNFTAPLYSEPKKSENVLDEKDAKITKLPHARKRYASTCNVETLREYKHIRIFF